MSERVNLQYNLAIVDMRKLYITWDPSHSPYQEVRVISNHPGLSIDGSEPLTEQWPGRGDKNSIPANTSR